MTAGTAKWCQVGGKGGSMGGGSDGGGDGDTESNAGDIKSGKE